MSVCAVVRLSDGYVENTIMASPSDHAPEGTQLIQIEEGLVVSMGDSWDGEKFIASQQPIASWTPPTE